MIKAIYFGIKAYVRDCRHDKELKQKQWMWRLFRIRDKEFDYKKWKRGSVFAYIRTTKEGKL